MRVDAKSSFFADVICRDTSSHSYYSSYRLTPLGIPPSWDSNWHTRNSGGLSFTTIYGTHSGLYAIVLTPTSDLYRQISAVLSTLIHNKNSPTWSSLALLAGVSRKKVRRDSSWRGLIYLLLYVGHCCIAWRIQKAYSGRE